MCDSAALFADFSPEKDFIVFIDSDGCTFDTLEIQQKECFCPAFINHYGLQPISKFARETWEFVTLYSFHRGVNRFETAITVLDYLRERNAIISRSFQVPSPEGLRRWLSSEPHPALPGLKAALEADKDPDLQTAYEWAVDVEDAILKIVRNVPPFPYAIESLEDMRTLCETIAVSSGPAESLRRQWDEHGLTPLVRIAAGQEAGTKEQIVQAATKGRAKQEQVLIIGDAPSDLQAAKEAGTLFFPIVPGKEEGSWQRFHQEGLDRFIRGTFSGAYAEKLIAEFRKQLPDKPPWQ